MSSVAKQTVVRMKDFSPGDVGARVSKALNGFTTQVSDSVQDWRSKAHSAAKSTDGFVRSSPWRAVGAIALAGMAAGMLVSLSVQRARRRGRLQDAADSGSETQGG